MKKIFIVLLIAGALCIIFYPRDEKPDLDGEWLVKQLIVNDKDIIVKRIYDIGDPFTPIKVIPDTFHIHKNSFRVSLYKHNSIGGEITFPHKDTLVIIQENMAG